MSVNIEELNSILNSKLKEVVDSYNEKLMRDGQISASEVLDKVYKEVGLKVTEEKMGTL